MQSILAQIPRVPSVYDRRLPVSRLIRRDPEDALAIIRDNVPTVFGPRARTVNLALLDEMTPANYTPINIYFIVVDDVLCDLDGDESMDLLRRVRTETEYKKATLRRISPDEPVRMEWLDEDVSGELAFETTDGFEEKMRRGDLVEMTDEVGTYVLDISGGGEFYFFHPHEPLVVTFVDI